jgi:hypothetical protein
MYNYYLYLPNRNTNSMAEESMESSSTWPPRKGKIKCGKGQACWDGGSGKSKDKPMFARVKMNKKKPAPAKPSGTVTNERHQNVRDLGAMPGQVSYSAQVKTTGNDDYATADQGTMKQIEKESTKKRKFFGR